MLKYIEKSPYSITLGKRERASKQASGNRRRTMPRPVARPVDPLGKGSQIPLDFSGEALGQDRGNFISSSGCEHSTADPEYIKLMDTFSLLGGERGLPASLLGTKD